MKKVKEYIILTIPIPLLQPLKVKF